MNARRSAPAIAVTLVAAAYGLLGLVVLAPEGVYSGDIGVKYVQARAVAASGFTSLVIPYPGAVIDAERRFFPLRPPFALTTAEGTQAIFSPASAVLQGAAALLAGIRGLTIVSIGSGVVILLAALPLVPREQRAPLAVVLGFGSPLWFYAVNGWEHAPAVACSTAAFACVARSSSRTAIVAAGVLVGTGAALRDEVLLVMPGLLAAVWLQQRRLAGLGLACLSALLPLAAAAVVEVFWFERPAAAHLRHAVHLLQSALHLTNEPNPEVPVLAPLTMEERRGVVVNYWLFGSTSDAGILTFVGGLVCAWLVRMRFGSSHAAAIVMALVCTAAAADTWEVLAAPKWLAGLFHVAPFVALAFLPAPPGARPNRWPGIILFTTLAYLVIAFAGVDTSGGKSLGPRLLLPLLPLLAAAAVIRLAQYLRGGTPVDRSVGWLGAMACLLAVAMHAGGTLPAYYSRNQEDAAAVLEASRGPQRIIVADDEFTAQLLFPLYYRKIVVLADSPESGAALGRVLADGRFQGGALVVSRRPVPAVVLHPLRPEESRQVGRMLLQQWRR